MPLSSSKLKCEIRRESVPVSANGLIENTRLNPVKQSQVAIQHDRLVTNRANLGRKDFLGH